MDNTAINLIQQTAIDANGLRIPRELGSKLAVIPKDYHLHSLEQCHPERFRFRGVFATAQLADFVEYVKKNTGGQGFITANANELESTVFFNLGSTDNPGHADWLARLHMEKTPAFEAITNTNGAAFSQRQIIDFIEDWSHLFRGWREGGDGGESSGIKVTTVISALRKIKISEKSEGESKQDNFKTSVSRLDSVEASSEYGLPDILTFTTEPYLGLQSRTISLRLSILTGGREPALKLRILSEDQLYADIAQEFKAKLIGEIGDAAPMLIGDFKP